MYGLLKKYRPDCLKEETEWRDCKKYAAGGMNTGLCTHYLYGVLHCQADAVLSKNSQNKV